jgi:SAM-dependent methyltransferase
LNPAKGRNRTAPSRAKRETSRAKHETQALQSLAKKRLAFEPLLAQVVAGVLHAHGPRAQAAGAGDPPEGPTREQNWIEVGSGLGQFRALLPSDVLGFVTHTELSSALARGFRERHPQARVLAADVERLPFEAESVDAVLGLCAFDSFAAPVNAVREIGRVLRAGGRFIHFLDAATNVEPILIDLVGADRLPLPNFLADAALLEPALLNLNDLGHLCGPFHDLLSVPVEHFELVTAMLARAGHPIATMLQGYSAPFLKRPFDALLAARAFVALTSDLKNSRPMNQALTSVVSTLRQPPYSRHMPFELAAHSSMAHFESRLKGYFGTDFGFAPRLSAVVYARAFEPNRGEPLRAHVRRVGIVQNSTSWPAPVGIPALQLKSDLPSSEAPGATSDSHILREAAVYAFVAEKTNAGLP